MKRHVRPTIENCLEKMDKLTVDFITQETLPVDVISSLIELRKGYLKATSGLIYSSKEENEKLFCRRIDTFEKIYNNVQHYRMLTFNDDEN
jgi:hypothetical protein